MLGLKLIHGYQWHHDMTMISIGSVDYPQKDQWCTHSIFHFYFMLLWRHSDGKRTNKTYSIFCGIHCNDSIWAVWLLIHRQLNCVFNILLSLTQKIKSPRLLALCEWNSPMIGWSVDSPHKGPVIQNAVPSQDVNTYAHGCVLGSYFSDWMIHGNKQPVFFGITSIAWWRHQMETFSALLALCEGNPPLTPNKGQWREALCFLWSAPDQKIE